MKGILISCIVLLLPGFRAGAQLEPLSDQYMLNGLSVNPAFAGADDALSLTFLHRNQWTGFEGAPVTSSFAVHSPLKKENLALGFLLVHDRIGIMRTTVFAGDYAYRIISPHGIFSFGLGGKLKMRNEALGELRPLDTDDEYLPVSSGTYLLPDFDIGFYYYTGKFRAGVSMVSILGSHIDPGKGRYGVNFDPGHTNCMISGEFFTGLGEGVRINPGTLVKFTPAKDFQVDLNTNVIIRDRFWFGASYRSKRSLICLVQFQVNRQARIAYSYGLDFSPLGNYHGGSHEIMLKYVFQYLIEAVGPRQF